MASSYAELTSVRSLWLPCEHTPHLQTVRVSWWLLTKLQRYLLLSLWYLRSFVISHQETHRVCHISANSQGTHKCDLTNSYHDELDVRLQNDVAVRYSCEVAVSISWSPDDIFVRSNSSLGSFRLPCVREVTSFSGSSGSMDEYLTDLDVFVQWLLHQGNYPDKQIYFLNILSVVLYQKHNV